MERLLAALFATIGCGVDPGPHDLIDCHNADWATIGYPSVTQCERACEPAPSPWPSVGAVCNVGSDAPSMSCGTFDYQGLRGCCLPGVPQHDVIRFYECK